MKPKLDYFERLNSNELYESLSIIKFCILQYWLWQLQRVHREISSALIYQSVLIYRAKFHSGGDTTLLVSPFGPSLILVLFLLFSVIMVEGLFTTSIQCVIILLSLTFLKLVVVSSNWENFIFLCQLHHEGHYIPFIFLLSIKKLLIYCSPSEPLPRLALSRIPNPREKKLMHRGKPALYIFSWSTLTGHMGEECYS